MTQSPRVRAIPRSSPLRGVGFWLPLGLLVLVGLFLRLDHHNRVWTFWTLDYLSYYGPIDDDLRAGLFPWNRLVGLHPPLHAILATTFLRLGGSVAGLLHFSALASLATLVLVALALRRIGRPGAGLVLALVLSLSPLHIHYAAELNNYPAFLLCAGLLLWSFAGLAHDRHPSGWDLLLLGLTSFLCLHSHLLGFPLVLAMFIGAFVLGQHKSSAAIAAGVLSWCPVALAMVKVASQRTTFHNESPELTQLPAALAGLWLGRFGDALMGCAALAALLMAVGSTTAMLRFGKAGPQRRFAGGLLVAFALSVASVLVVLLSGVGSTQQSPYWLVPSLFSWTLVSLACTARATPLRYGLLASLCLWVLFVPGSPVFADASSGPSKDSAAALRQAVLKETEPGDAIVYLWEPLFLNDAPQHRDPLLAAFPAAELGSFEGRHHPCRNYNFTWRERSLCVLPSTAMRRGEYEERLAADVESWVRSGRQVGLIRASFDPARGRPSSSSLIERLPESVELRRTRPGGVEVVWIRDSVSPE